MDINKDNELLEENYEEASDNTEVEDTIIDIKDAEESLTNKEEMFDDSLENLDEITNEEYESEPAKKKACPVQKPIIISIMAFLLTAVIVFSSVFVYNMVVGEEEKFSVAGVWTLAEDTDSKVYYVFEEDGVFNVNIGGQILTGSYLLEDVEDTSTEGEEKDVYHILTLTPNVFSNYESQALVTLDEDKNTMSLGFMYIAQVNLVRTELPEFKLDGSKVTHASADEFGIDTFVGDEDILGTWLFKDYSGDVTYTFNADGTGSLMQEYKEGGYSITTVFKYITVDGKILVTIELLNGSTSDGEINYYMDKGKIIINNIAFDKVK